MKEDATQRSTTQGRLGHPPSIPEASTTPHTIPHQPESLKSILDQAIAIALESVSTDNGPAVKQSELALYFGGTYPCTNRYDPQVTRMVENSSNPTPRALADRARCSCHSRRQRVSRTALLKHEAYAHRLPIMYDWDDGIKNCCYKGING
ncbi:hypothetical protein BDN67DRAFT_968312 [Paxillus ammoniavirescens]|nr:hypothetical protein BDN67DRAFT_968312 [Paxillus ammoniavirescens]